METTVRGQQDGSPTSPTPSPSHRRAPSGSSLLSRFPFIKNSQEAKSRSNRDDNDSTPVASRTTARTSTAIIQQQKTRRRKGSLRKVALLGRGAQRERRDSKPLTIETSHLAAFGLDPSSIQTQSPEPLEPLDFNESPERTPRPSIDSQVQALRAIEPISLATQSAPILPVHDIHSSYTSTDEEDMLQLPRGSALVRSGLGMSPGPDSYFGSLGSETVQRRRSIHRAKSPLSYGGLTTSTMPAHETEWDYADTEWWGWVVLCVTWFVFVIGMGSCFDIWSWAWDVGKTPYAPPELEDDPTLPVVGYYPVLIILTGIMAWVWVLTAWVGMKYFRHAKISGD
ncbi:hypothetical protein B0T10DRAFT_282637 [Thelonectria olida]|uniref:Uncharacterized protein n=1 Tax=Thelonectria olida TaxID=1576542 RepID=A0A9P9ATX3_9HYPO|nr:hypothetical protein B0T10DRAFT_282637 [Thelonectria olida]